MLTNKYQLLPNIRKMSIVVNIIINIIALYVTVKILSGALSSMESRTDRFYNCTVIDQYKKVDTYLYVVYLKQHKTTYKLKDSMDYGLYTNVKCKTYIDMDEYDDEHKFRVVLLEN